MQTDRKTVILTKDDELYIFVYDPMDGCKLLDAIVAQVKNKETDFCWEDAFEAFRSLMRPFFEEIHILSKMLEDQSLG